MIIPCFLIIYYGNYYYDTGLFEKTVSPEKLPYGIVEVCEEMLRIEDEPKCVADLYPSCYIREYSGKIKQLYGRNAVGFITSFGGKAKEIYNASHVDGDFYTVFDYCINHGYHFVVTVYNREIDENLCNIMGFKEILTIPDYYHLYYYTGVTEQ